MQRAGGKEQALIRLHSGRVDMKKMIVTSPSIFSTVSDLRSPISDFDETPSPTASGRRLSGLLGDAAPPCRASSRQRPAKRLTAGSIDPFDWVKDYIDHVRHDAPTSGEPQLRPMSDQARRAPCSSERLDQRSMRENHAALRQRCDLGVVSQTVYQRQLQLLKGLTRRVSTGGEPTGPETVLIDELEYFRRSVYFQANPPHLPAGRLRSGTKP